MKKFLCVLISIVTIIVSAIALCGCSNKTDSLGADCTYALTYECGDYVLHEVSNWGYDEGVVSVELKCCDMVIVTSTENVILYQKEPNNLGMPKYKLCSYIDNN